MKLSESVPGQTAKITAITVKGTIRRRLLDMGLTPGTEVTLLKLAPLGDPMIISIRGYELSLRKNECESIAISVNKESI